MPDTTPKKSTTGKRVVLILLAFTFFIAAGRMVLFYWPIPAATTQPQK